jgi:hypothetical protein
MTPPGKEVPAGKYLMLAFLFSLFSFPFFPLCFSVFRAELSSLPLSSSSVCLLPSVEHENERGKKMNNRRKTHPPYFKTVISGIAAPSGKLLIISFHSFRPSQGWIEDKIGRCRGFDRKGKGKIKTMRVRRVKENNKNRGRGKHRRTFRPERKIHLFPSRHQ